MDSTERFGSRVADYVRYRPGYPKAVVPILEESAGLTPSSIIADVGSGTGLSAELFLANGNTVYAVEPNDGMREAAEERLRAFSGFHSVKGTAEATTLDGGSVDLVVAAQAFHWFDRQAARREFERILIAGGWMVLIWNRRRVDATPFLADYEKILLDYGTDYRKVDHTNITEPELASFLGVYGSRTLYNEQIFDFQGLQGRLLSSSYTPAEDDAARGPMLKELSRIFERHEVNGKVRIEYDTEVYFGQISA